MYVHYFFPIDTIILIDKDGNKVPLTKTGIAWESDKKYKFQNPEVPPEYKNLAECKIFSRLVSMSCGNFCVKCNRTSVITRTHGRKSCFAANLYKNCQILNSPFLLRFDE